ncbi:hypothetical protein [Rubripirellula reticaptiva]|uniref:Uncharacterized protein n=1 Tax=Rubripirellula reticaptiva TaxID=2528013 RepID=A0A5C6F4S8_9BACT|nr:hypothetical protein [Rubripirellula reticaptiva]TWU55514.1 hypothetical protein Poly59_18130 [Rubripirellula reticaptiva]
MNVTTFTIESVHGVKQVLSFENFTVGPQPQRTMAQPTTTQPTATATPTQTATTATEPRR